MDDDWRYEQPYPPLGFRPIADCELGNGDRFGFYWPVGKEDAEPLVAEMWHDGGLLQPTYSSLPAFLAARDQADERYPEPPTLVEDARSPRALLEAAKEALREQHVEAANHHLEVAVEVLPEFTEALTLLWAQCVRQKDWAKATEMALRAIIAPPAFGSRAIKPLRWLQARHEALGFEDDPIWINRQALKLEYGGLKENPDYAVFLAAIDAYTLSGRYVSAVVLMQTYAHLLGAETISFQERNGFRVKDFVQWQKDVSGKLPSGPRE